MGLREEKKQATRTAIADAALGLFLEQGFDRVTVADVARVARVSVNTVFNYFPTKEDLFFDRQEQVVQRLPAAIRDRADGESAVAALRRAFLAELDREEATLGLDPGMAGFWRVVEESAALQARLRQMRDRTEAAIADTLRAQTGVDDAMPPIAAAMIAAVDSALHAAIRRRLLAGEDPDAVRAQVRAAARVAFDALERGLGTYATKGAT
ncbi:TetR/AcrR family transcriptional regulator [Actinoplanes teichomyceticus]|uniref:TetR family transcriptional regulator n=1 Tax=Actinoplanes teichomyceticus TaxID=1867 RepID=A0A561WA67_ACTTI|nr:TetR family transcriptional regulator [Actinoplanes teichomyceticus]TWG20751.1 TetR family transcriptional regulator [Actinoplanes teichomyceticus]GIF14407.1 TetR family transcriptional regulator [Actinoplanes teichomyceticus]